MRVNNIIFRYIAKKCQILIDACPPRFHRRHKRLTIFPHSPLSIIINFKATPVMANVLPVDNTETVRAQRIKISIY